MKALMNFVRRYGIFVLLFLLLLGCENSAEQITATATATLQPDAISAALRDDEGFETTYKITLTPQPTETLTPTNTPQPTATLDREQFKKGIPNEGLPTAEVATTLYEILINQLQIDTPSPTIEQFTEMVSDPVYLDCIHLALGFTTSNEIYQVIQLCWDAYSDQKAAEAAENLHTAAIGFVVYSYYVIVASIAQEHGISPEDLQLKYQNDTEFYNCIHIGLILVLSQQVDGKGATEHVISCFGENDTA